MFSPHLAGHYGKARLPQFVVQFAVDQVHLTQIRLRRIARHPRTVFYRRAEMRVALDPEPLDQPDAVLVGFDQCVAWTAAHRRDHSAHLGSLT